MKLNDLLTKQNVLTKIVLDNGTESLSKELKVKVMRMRIAFNKAKTKFDEDVKEFADQLVTEEYKTLANKIDRTDEEENKFVELSNKINSEYQEYLIQKGEEEVNTTIDSITEEEYYDIMNLNLSKNIEINNNTIPAADFMEIFYTLFVK